MAKYQSPPPNSVSRCTHVRGASHTRSPCSSPTTRDNSNSRKAPKSAHETQSQPARILLFGPAQRNYMCELLINKRPSLCPLCSAPSELCVKSFSSSSSPLVPNRPIPVNCLALPVSAILSFADLCGVSLHASALRRNRHRRRPQRPGQRCLSRQSRQESSCPRTPPRSRRCRRHRRNHPRFSFLRVLLCSLPPPPRNHSRTRPPPPRPGNPSPRRHVHPHAQRRSSLAHERPRPHPA